MSIKHFFFSVVFVLLSIASTAQCNVNFTWQGLGPYGQLDVNITQGSAPYKIYRGSTLLYSGSSSFVTLNFGCNGGPIKVEANTSCGVRSKLDIVPAGCASGYFGMLEETENTKNSISESSMGDQEEIKESIPEIPQVTTE